MHEEGIKENYSFAFWCSQAWNIDNALSLILIPWWYCSFTSLKCRLLDAFLFIFCLSNTTCSLGHSAGLCLFLNFSWCLCCSICGSDSDYLCIHVSRQLQISCGWHLLALSLPTRIHTLTHTHFRSPLGIAVWLKQQVGWGLPRRQISLTIYLHSLYFPLMGVQEEGSIEASVPTHCTINILVFRVLHPTLWFHPIRRDLRASLQSPAGKTHPSNSCLPGRDTHGCSRVSTSMSGRVAPRPVTAMVIHSPCNKKIKGTFVLINQGPCLGGNLGLKKKQKQKQERHDLF